MRFLSFIVVLVIGNPVAAQPKTDPKSQPRVIVALPLAAKSGATTKITLRGVNLDKTTEASVSDPIKVKVLDKGKSAPPDQKLLDKLGDTQAVIELTIPADFNEDTISVTIKTAENATQPHRVLVDRQPLQTEKEPNDGFRQGQPITLPLTLEGAVKSNQDVDVFCFEGVRGQRVRFEVAAARHGSPIDPILTLYDGSGSQVAASAKCKDSVDCELEATLPRPGMYSLVLQDAHDLGSAMHLYRLSGK